uniref:Transmembrane protein n=1 Tax=Arabidopsis thaliana TaxID=3702 RepID=Q1PE91_ARATH|nr:unknown [Arabidopsis thaliana]
MEVPKGFFEKLWSFVSFLPYFFLLLLLGVTKALIIGPISSAIILVGNSCVIIGLWPAHFIWTYYCLARTKRIGLVLKTLALVLFPLPLLLWPVAGIVGSLFGGIAYGFFTPLMATFEAVGESVTSKCYHCFVDGSFSTIKGSCTVVTDFTDFCFHSYFSYMDELREMVSADVEPLEIKLSRLPSCLLASLIGVMVDVLLITAVAVYKSPYMLLKGWKRLLEDLVGREGPFLESVCVPFAGLAILLWPLAVAGAVIASVLSSFFLGLYSGVIVHQEDSFRMGLNYIIAAVSLFDEYVNDLLYLREGTSLPSQALL